MLTGILACLTACGPPVARIHVQPSAIVTDGAALAGRAIALHVAPAVRDLRVVGTRELSAMEGPGGMHGIEVEYDVGTPLAESIRAVLAHRVAVATSEDGSCPADARGVLDVELATLVTPGTLTLERDQLHEVTITNAGYVTAHRCIAPRQDGVIWGNLALGGVVGILVDQGDGAVYALDPDEMDVTLVPEDPDASGR